MLSQKPILVIACGALSKEIVELKRLNKWHTLDIQCIDAYLHFKPALIPARLKTEIAKYRDKYDKIFVAYADCGTAGEIDRVLAEEDIERLPGADCFASFAGQQRFADLAEAEPGTFYLTDFLCRHFDSMVMKTLGIDQHPELRDAYFGNYKRLVYLSQTTDAELMEQAREAAVRLKLKFEHVHCGYGELETSLHAQLIHPKLKSHANAQKNSNLLA